jgi:hypothetical protein
MSKIDFLPAKTNERDEVIITFLTVTFANAVPGFIFAPPNFKTVPSSRG